VAALAGVALLVAAALGVGIGALVAPSGEAARGPVAVGFIPEPGWFAFQTGGEASPVYQKVAVAANVPLDPEDLVAGAADPSGLPYATLVALPRDGVVIVASFTRESTVPSFGPSLSEQKLPLRLGQGTPYIQYGTQVRPDAPLGQYEVRASVKGHHVHVQVYFGVPDPSPALLAEAQRQLDRLVVTGKEPSPERKARQPAVSAASSAPGRIDRTFTCAPSLIGGVRQIDARARRGSGRTASGWEHPAFAAISTTVSGSAATAIEDELAWISAGQPSTSATVVTTLVGLDFPFRSWGTVAVNAKRCRPSAAKVPLSPKGLQGGAMSPFDDQWDCATGRQVLVHVRAVLGSASPLKSYRGFLRTTVPVKEASLAVRTASGKPLVYARVLGSGKSFLYTAPGCFPD
jgi:hypothetical protein